ncbi:MAG: cytidylyltransferase domain-containing protein [Burkholderiales bacterium]
MFNGKPMIAWTIEAARESDQFDRVFVSTDSEEIAAIAKKHDVDVPFLRDQYCDDVSSVSDVTVYALEQIEKKLGEKFEVVAQLMASCPLRTAKTIREGMTKFYESKVDFQMSCFKFGWMNPWWALSLDGENRPRKMFPEALEKRSQDLPELYCPTGALWIARVDKLLKSKTFYGPDHRFFPIHWRGAIDIDNQEDWEMAELLSGR